MEKIGFLGSGNMATALIKGLVDSGLYNAKDIVISDISQEKIDSLKKSFGVQSSADNKTLAGGVDILVLSVKPQNAADVLEDIKDSLKPDTLIISIMAGVKISKITDILADRAVIRVMPNTPALIGQGASALFANEKAGGCLEKAVAVFESAGKAVTVETEDMIDAVTAISGSGPAYYLFLMEQMINTAVELGLPEDKAKILVFQTASGTAQMAQSADNEGICPAELRRNVTSPGGTTEAALKVFEENNLAETVNAALKKAYQRSKELSL